jgi:seryl-tRNA synthetase
MLDIKIIRSNPEIVKEALIKKHVDVDVDEIAGLDQDYRKALTMAESLRSEQKQLSKQFAQAEGGKEKAKEELKQLKEKIKEYDESAQEMKRKLDEQLLQLPNFPHESVPEGIDESENVVIRQWGETPKFDFKPKDHVEIGNMLNLLDIERAGKVSGARFYYLKKEAVLLEVALISFVFNLLSKEGFIPVIPPVLVKENIMQGGGYLPGGEDEIYKMAKDDLYLVGTSEQSILGMHANEILDKNVLPLRYVGFSTCFRREAGSYGKDVRGILRAHQFDKVEMFSFCPAEESWQEHERLLANEEKIMQELGLPYQVVMMCAGDLGAPAAKKYDIEVWLPGQDRYRETHSTSNCTDFQARRLNIRCRRAPQEPVEFVHTLNGTAAAIGRMIIAILENYQQADGSVVIPSVLRPYVGEERILPQL